MLASEGMYFTKLVALMMESHISFQILHPQLLLITFYSSSLILVAMVAYKVAVAFLPSDLTPLSNLSAATFESGDYKKSLQFANEALALLKEETDDDPRKQKLLSRLNKPERYLSESKPDDSIHI